MSTIIQILIVLLDQMTGQTLPASEGLLAKTSRHVVQMIVACAVHIHFAMTKENIMRKLESLQRIAVEIGF
jgi:hypothetical protein